MRKRILNFIYCIVSPIHWVKRYKVDWDWSELLEQVIEKDAIDSISYASASIRNTKIRIWLGSDLDYFSLGSVFQVNGADIYESENRLPSALVQRKLKRYIEKKFKYTDDLSRIKRAIRESLTE